MSLSALIKRNRQEEGKWKTPKLGILTKYYSFNMDIQELIKTHLRVKFYYFSFKLILINSQIISNTRLNMNMGNQRSTRGMRGGSVPRRRCHLMSPRPHESPTRDLIVDFLPRFCPEKIIRCSSVHGINTKGSDRSPGLISRFHSHPTLLT